MKFLLDENFPKSAEKILTSLNHTVIDIRGTDLQGSDDLHLFRLAQQHQAVLLTTDRDFYHTVSLQQPRHFGVVVIALKQPNRHSILVRLHWLISKGLLDNIADQVILVRDHTYRIRSAK